MTPDADLAAALHALVPFLEAHHMDAGSIIESADRLEQLAGEVERLHLAINDAIHWLQRGDPGRAERELQAALNRTTERN